MSVSFPLLILAARGRRSHPAESLCEGYMPSGSLSGHSWNTRYEEDPRLGKDRRSYAPGVFATALETRPLPKQISVSESRTDYHDLPPEIIFGIHIHIFLPLHDAPSTHTLHKYPRTPSIPTHILPPSPPTPPRLQHSSPPLPRPTSPHRSTPDGTSPAHRTEEMPSINAALLAIAINSTLNATAIAQPPCPARRGLGPGDKAAIVLGCGFGFSMLMQCYLSILYRDPIRREMARVFGV